MIVRTKREFTILPIITLILGFILGFAASIPSEPPPAEMTLGEALVWLNESETPEQRLEALELLVWLETTGAKP